jgi:hypothetical protein
MSKPEEGKPDYNENVPSKKKQLFLGIEKVQIQGGMITRRDFVTSAILIQSEK